MRWIDEAWNNNSNGDEPEVEGRPPVYFKAVNPNGSINGYVEGNEYILYGHGESWSNWYRPNGDFAASLERISDFDAWLTWARSQPDLVEIDVKDFPGRK